MQSVANEVATINGELQITTKGGSSEEEGNQETLQLTVSNGKKEVHWCRICHAEDDLDNLLAPCKCSGTLKYVHQFCLEEWKKLSPKFNKKRCEICKVLFFKKVKHKQ